MPELRDEPQASTGTEPLTETLRKNHAARARSAYVRAEAACRHAGIGPDAVELVPKSPAGRAAHSLRLSAQSLSALATSAPDPAADARCARNVAAAAALAAQAAQTHGGENDNGSEAASHAATRAASNAASNAAFHTAVKASQAAAAAAGGSAAGRDPVLNAAAEQAEKDAVEAARAAGWIQPRPR